MAMAIVVVAVVILVYFAFFSGKEVPESKLRDEISGESVINAEVGEKRAERLSGKYSHLFNYYVSFACEDGESREFSVNSAIYEAIETGERDVLVYSGERFVGFGDHGAVEGETDAHEEAGEDGFTYDDYDESIDIEQEAEAIPADRMDPADQAHFDLFQSREKLPGETETVEDETEALREYDPSALLEKMTIYPFLKRENDVRRMFFRTFGEAVNDLLGFEGDARRGRSADSVIMNRNEIRVAITIEENPKPLRDRITAEIGVND